MSLERTPDGKWVQSALVARLFERFGSKVAHVGGGNCCIEYIGSRARGGYGHVRIGSRKDGTRTLAYAHRIAWELVNGAIPDGLKVLHACDNPPCVNPAHLFLGTQKDNVRDMWAKGRQGGAALPRRSAA